MPRLKLLWSLPAQVTLSAYFGVIFHVTWSHFWSLLWPFLFRGYAPPPSLASEWALSCCPRQRCFGPLGSPLEDPFALVILVARVGHIVRFLHPWQCDPPHELTLYLLGHALYALLGARRGASDIISQGGARMHIWQRSLAKMLWHS